MEEGRAVSRVETSRNLRHTHSNLSHDASAQVEYTNALSTCRAQKAQLLITERSDQNMKRNTLIAVVLCLMMITTAGAGTKSTDVAGTKSAQQGGNAGGGYLPPIPPFPPGASAAKHAGKSSIYFYDVEATDNHGYGKLVIDTNKNTFIFIGQDFKPGQHVYLQFKTDGDFAVFASGKSTPSGNLHVAGTWELDAYPRGCRCRLLHLPSREWLFLVKLWRVYGTFNGLLHN